MEKLRTKQFQLLTDINLVWDFQTEIYDREIGYGKGLHWSFWKKG